MSSGILRSVIEYGLPFLLAGELPLTLAWRGRVCPGYIPAPLLFGALIDSTCRLWERAGGAAAATRCHGGVGGGGGGTGGSCLVFDTDQLRWRTYGVSLCIQALQLACVVLLYLAIRRRNLDSAGTGGDGDDDQVQQSAGSVDGVVAKPAASPTAEQLALLQVDVAQP